jgi:hypothetical protein
VEFMAHVPGVAVHHGDSGFESFCALPRGSS